MFNWYFKSKKLHSSFLQLNNEAMAVLKLVASNPTEENINYLNELDRKLEYLLEELIEANLIVDAGLIICSKSYIRLTVTQGEIFERDIENDILEFQNIIKYSVSISKQGAYQQAIKFHKKMLDS